MIVWTRFYKIVDDRTDTTYSRYSEEYDDNTLWVLEDDKYWVNPLPFKVEV